VARKGCDGGGEALGLSRAGRKLQAAGQLFINLGDSHFDGLF
jgi:hypothetical protein